MVTRLGGVLALLVTLCAMALGMATPTLAAIPAEAKYCAGMIAPLTAEDKANGRLSQVLRLRGRRRQPSRRGLVRSDRRAHTC